MSSDVLPRSPQPRAPADPFQDGSTGAAETTSYLADPVSDRADMMRIDGGTFRMGSDHHYPEEAPAHHVTVDGFWIDRMPVTNADFRRFVQENGYGLVDVIGNVWEWTTDWYAPKHDADALKGCCIPENPRGGSETGSYDPCQPEIRIPRKVIKGGSHLCAPSYCRRYRPAARHAQPVDTSTSHVGFRCVIRERRV